MACFAIRKFGEGFKVARLRKGKLSWSKVRDGRPELFLGMVRQTDGTYRGVWVATA
jgi:hypothetical protein